MKVLWDYHTNIDGKDSKNPSSKNSNSYILFPSLKTLSILNFPEMALGKTLESFLPFPA